jgi:hypothetical protein
MRISRRGFGYGSSPVNPEAEISIGELRLPKADAYLSSYFYQYGVEAKPVNIQGIRSSFLLTWIISWAHSLTIFEYG